MPSIYNQYEVNSRGSKTAQNIIQTIGIGIYEAIKWLFNFAGIMLRQFMGK